MTEQHESALRSAFLAHHPSDLSDAIQEAFAVIDVLSAQNAAMLGACVATEEWWLREGMKETKIGAPYCIFAVRAAVKLCQPPQAAEEKP